MRKLVYYDVIPHLGASSGSIFPGKYQGPPEPGFSRYGLGRMMHHAIFVHILVIAYEFTGIDDNFNPAVVIDRKSVV
jgi:hypothetical protein